MFILNKGTILYRVTDKFENYIPNYDNDTGKTGLYFANYQALPLGMVLEYNREKMILCTYQITEDIKIFSMGKYNFRELNLSLYYTEDGKFIPNVGVPKELNVSHFESDMYPIIYDENKNFLYTKEFEELDKNKYGEIFLSDTDLKKITLLHKQECYYNDIKEKFDTFGILDNNYF
jgi:hypothetical protein